MAIVKPAVAGRPPITLTADGQAATTQAEVVAVHYLNLTAGAGRVDIYDGAAIPANRRITIGSDAANGNDDFSPAQPMKFFNNVNVVFTTGTGVVTVLMN